MNRHPKPSLEQAQDPLHDYKSKRDFALTPEPAEGGQHLAHQLTFVVQKHWASSLHYDFRLELDGTMAVQVEDHLLAYADFEGTVHAKQYGAGKVIIWDAGTWIPSQDPQQGLREGNLK